MKLLLALSILLLNTFIAYGGPIQDGVYYIINRAFLQVIQVPDWSYVDGTAVNFDSITGGDNQKFQLTSVGNDFYKISALHNGKLLTVPSFMSAGDASQIIQWTDSGENLQHWNIFSEDYNGFYTIQNRYSGKVLTATQEYIYQPWGVDKNVAADGSVAAIPQEAADGAPRAEDMMPPLTWYYWKNKLTQSTISPGNTYQDFLFVKVAGYGTVEEPIFARGFADSASVENLQPAVEAPVEELAVSAEPGDPAIDDPRREVMTATLSPDFVAKQSASEVEPAAVETSKRMRAKRPAAQEAVVEEAGGQQ